MTEQAMQIREPSPAPTVIAASESAAVISMIERAARDPNVDIDKMERLMQMHTAVLDRQARSAYAAALAAMQPDLPSIKERGGIKDRDGKIQSRYALWEDINDAIKPVMAQHGFALSFRVSHPEGKIAVTGVLSHRDGHSEETTIALPHDATGSKNAVQAVGSSTSYGKRYTAAALLNLTSHGEDDDGKAAGGPQTISAEQIETLRARIVEIGNVDLPAFLKHLKVARLDDLEARYFKDAMSALDIKAARAKQEARP